MIVRDYLISKKRSEFRKNLMHEVYLLVAFFVTIMICSIDKIKEDDFKIILLVVIVLFVIAFFVIAYPWGMKTYISSVESGNFKYSFEICTGVTKTNNSLFNFYTIKTDLGKYGTKESVNVGDRVLVVKVNGTRSIYNVTSLYFENIT